MRKSKAQGGTAVIPFERAVVSFSSHLRLELLRQGYSPNQIEEALKSFRKQ